MKIIIAGSSGFVGSHLRTYFKEHDLILLSRSTEQPSVHFWDPESKQIDPSILEGADVVINLCGESILGRWNQKKMDQIRSSRLISTEFLCNTLLQLNSLPKLYIGASAIGYYGDRGDEELSESSAPGHGYLAELCREWEAIPEKLCDRGVRVTFARFGTVLGSDGGALKQLDKAFRMGMGGVLGSGEQFMSWIAMEDVGGALQHLIEHPEIKGAVNFVAPGSLSNKEFTHILGHLLNRPTIVPVPKFALSMLFGSGADIFLASTRVLPKVLLDSGYQFQYPQVEEALKKYLLIKV
ncbi:MAG: Epimerase family protein [Chlamydiales bacterium]|nr:Epimerase family protein [Chlamydiales bacterium]